MKRDEMLVPRLDFLIPMNFFLSQDWQLNFGVDSKTAIGRVAELNPEWVIEVVNNGELKLSDVLHDFKGIYSEDEHFVPRIQSDDILGDFDENGDAVDGKVNGYTNIQTYRLCLVLDNEQVVPNPLKRFLELVQEDEFESNDIDVINWNEVIERYSDSILLEHSFYANK